MGVIIVVVVAAGILRVLYKVGEEIHRDRCGWRR